MKGISKAEVKKQLEYWFERLEISVKKKVQELPKEWPRKLICRVCAAQTQIVDFDEPWF
jgi:ABC-2 type transport system ATP-binding protein